MIVQFSKPNVLKALSLILILSACAQPPNYAPVKTVNQAVEPNNGYYLRKKIPVQQPNNPDIPKQTTKTSQIQQQPYPIEQQPVITVRPYAESPKTRLNQAYISNQNKKKRDLPDLNTAIATQRESSQRAPLPGQAKNTPNSKLAQVDVNKGLITAPKGAPSVGQQIIKQPKSNSVISSSNASNTAKNPQNNLKLSDNFHPSQKNNNEKTSIISIDNKKMLKLNFGWPLRGKIFRNFVQTDNKGIDIAGKIGQPVHAAESGKIVYCGYGLAGLGNLAIIKHNDVYLSAYANNSQLFIKEGQQITKGQTIGQVGLKSPALHFEIRKNGRPINPLTLLPKQ